MAGSTPSRRTSRTLEASGRRLRARSKSSFPFSGPTDMIPPEGRRTTRRAGHTEAPTMRVGSPHPGGIGSSPHPHAGSSGAREPDGRRRTLHRGLPTRPRLVLPRGPGVEGTGTDRGGRRAPVPDEGRGRLGALGRPLRVPIPRRPPSSIGGRRPGLADGPGDRGGPQPPPSAPLPDPSLVAGWSSIGAGRKTTTSPRSSSPGLTPRRPPGRAGSPRRSTPSGRPRSPPTRIAGSRPAPCCSAPTTRAGPRRPTPSPTASS